MNLDVKTIAKSLDRLLSAVFAVEFTPLSDERLERRDAFRSRRRIEQIDVQVRENRLVRTVRVRENVAERVVNSRLTQRRVVRRDFEQFVEEFDRSVLNDFERVCIQTVAWKQDKTFQLKPALSTELRIDVTKFYKLHVFRPNEFFRDPNWCLDVIRDDRPVRSVFVNAEQLQEALMDKKKADERPVAPAAPSKKEKKPDVIEVDLHIHELLDNTSGLSNGDMLMAQMNEFRKVMDENIKKKGQKIVFIHGKGEGVLRKTILQELKYRYKNCSWQDASFREYGFGATLVKVN